MSYFSWLLDSPLIYRLGSGLVHFLWQGAIVAAVLSIALWLLRGRSAGTRYVASWMALVAMATCVLVTLWVTDVPPSVPDSAADVEAMALSEPLWQDPEGPVVGRNQDVLTVDADERDVGVWNAGERHGAETVVETPAQGPTGRLDSSSGDLRQWWSWALPWIVGGWLVGAIGLSLWRLGGWLHLRRLRRVGTSAATHETVQVLERLLERLRVSQPVRLLESTLARSPVVIGWLRPVVLLPVSIVAELPPQQLEMILAHELAHIRRWDFLWNLVQTVIETLLFYHPAVWWVSRRIRVEREACCDDMAARIMGDRLLYAQSLASLEEMRHQRRRQPDSSLRVAADNGVLLGRIRRVLGLPNEDRRAGHGWLGGILAVSLVVATLAGYMATADEPAERAEATISDEAGKRAASNEQSPTSPPPTISSGEAKDSIRMETSPPEPALGTNNDQPSADAEPAEEFAGIVTDGRGRPLEGVTVKMCGVEKFHDGRWHRNGRPDCLVPRPTKSDETGRFAVEFTEATFDMPFDEKKTRVNLWFDKEGYAPTYLAGVSPKPEDTKVVLRRGIQVSGTVKRQTNAQLTPIEEAVVYLQCSSGDLAHQKRVFDDPYFFLREMKDAKGGCDLPYRQRVLTDADGGYTVTLSPPPKDKRWFLVCSDEAWNKDSAWRGPKLVKGVFLDLKAGRPTKGPDFVVDMEAGDTANGKDTKPSLQADLDACLSRLCASVEQAFEDVGLSEEDVKAALAVQAPPQKLWKPFGEAWPAIREARAKAAREMADLGPDVVPLLLKAKDESWGGVNRGDLFADAIERIGKPAVPHTIEALSDRDHGVRARAITALGKIGDTRAVDPLIRLVDDPDRGIIRSVVWALGLLRDHRAAGPLLRLWDKGEFRREIAMALGAIGDKRAVQPIMNALDQCVDDAHDTGNWHQQDMTMLRYIGALKELGDPTAIPLLKRLLEAGPHPQRTKVGAKYMLAEEAADALRSFGFHVEGDIDEGGYRILTEKKPSRQMDVEQFLGHMSKVAKGWSQQRLLDHAGQPFAKSEDGWLYKSYVSPVAGGEYLSFRFKMVNGAVTEIHRTQGSVSTAPVQN